MTTKIVDGMYKNNGLLYPKYVNEHLWNKAIADIANNNTWCPDVTRVVFNTKTEALKTVIGKDGKPVIVDKKTGAVKKELVKLDDPILTTMVEFSDNTRVTVTNSGHDKIELVKDPETGAIVASDASKEVGLVYAIVKKMVGKANDKGVVEGNGFGRILHDLVTKDAVDQQIVEKKAILQKEESKKRCIEAKKAHEAKLARPPRMTLAKAMDALAVALRDIDNLKNQLEATKKPSKKNA